MIVKVGDMCYVRRVLEPKEGAGRMIVKIRDYYLEWNGPTDAPSMFGMKREEFEDWYRSEAPKHIAQEGIFGFAARMRRVEKTGTSSLHGTTAADLIDGNRAGPDESCLTEEELYRAYCLREPIRDGWVVPEAEG